MRVIADFTHIAWYVIRPPHTACWMLDDTRRRVDADFLDVPIVDVFPQDGLHVEVSVSRSADVYRRVHVTDNTVRSTMLAVYLFYWLPIGHLAAIDDIPDDRVGYRSTVVDRLNRGEQPVWADMIGKDFTHRTHPMIAEERRDLVSSGEGYCDGLCRFNSFEVVTPRLLRLDCNS